MIISNSSCLNALILQIARGNAVLQFYNEYRNPTDLVFIAKGMKIFGSGSGEKDGGTYHTKWKISFSGHAESHTQTQNILNKML